MTRNPKAFERELAELEMIGGIRIAPVEGQDGTLYMDALVTLKSCVPSFPDKAEAQFMQDVEAMRERNKNNKPSWTWKAIGWLLLGFGLAVWMFYEGMN